jgi:hypothetical protein
VQEIRTLKDAGAQRCQDATSTTMLHMRYATLP